MQNIFEFCPIVWTNDPLNFEILLQLDFVLNLDFEF